MGQPEVSIERGLPEDLRHEAALVFDQGFGDKMSFGIRDDRRRLALIEQAFVADDFVVAMVGDELAGLAGLKTRDGRYAKGSLSDEALSLRSLYRHLGFVGAPERRASAATPAGGSRRGADGAVIARADGHAAQVVSDRLEQSLCAAEVSCWARGEGKSLGP